MTLHDQLWGHLRPDALSRHDAGHRPALALDAFGGDDVRVSSAPCAGELRTLLRYSTLNVSLGRSCDARRICVSMRKKSHTTRHAKFSGTYSRLSKVSHETVSMMKIHFADWANGVSTDKLTYG